MLMTRGKRMQAEWMTVAQILAESPSDELGLSSQKILRWIRANKLQARDVAPRGAGRPEYRVNRAEWKRALENLLAGLRVDST